jgi:hypothetical protein
MTFHSPSAEAGHTPYVRTDADLEAFLARIEGYLDYFFGTLGGRSTTVEQFRDHLTSSGHTGVVR